ncbi:hypothetical protein Tco_0109704 [Tanacetum coccineum]
MTTGPPECGPEVLFLQNSEALLHPTACTASSCLQDLHLLLQKQITSRLDPSMANTVRLPKPSITSLHLPQQHPCPISQIIHLDITKSSNT